MPISTPPYESSVISKERKSAASTSEAAFPTLPVSQIRTGAVITTTTSPPVPTSFVSDLEQFLGSR